ncbi:limonene-1,2-epoxide hydrolase [Nocardioides sp. J9]|uniref:limonene-1,2-epoxide hydrolase family protein n=1 Tax=Nocardioides sp. J9 TaxID=935844 RepID=UPI0011AD830C|nr:limonene-1,2-epoxide hydrolase family protein [Nocardioides sp. J9]TWH00014.1 limonene-1,2-epoxide hydrolase [Nocardioides sp. J9]
MTSEIEVVQRFLGRLQEMDVEGAVALCADDVVYQNVPLPAARGRKAVRRQLKAMTKLGTGFEVQMRNIAANGPVVLTERVDVLRRGSFAMEFWVCGTFEVEGGKIVLWRDYFDWPTFLAAGVRGAGRVARQAVATRRAAR